MADATIPDTAGLLQTTVDRYRRQGRGLVRFKIFEEGGKVIKRPLDEWKSGPVDDFVIDQHVALGQPVGMLVPDGLLVLDFDPRNGGNESYQRLVTTYPEFRAWAPATECVATGGNGRHFYGTIPAELRVRGSLPGYPGLDIKGPGSLVIIPGSSYPGGRSYTSRREGPALPLPECILQQIAVQGARDNAGARGDMDFETVESLLEEITNDDVPYDDWLRVIAAVHHELGEEGRELAEEWSARSGKHTSGKFEQAWESFGRYAGASSTGGTLRMLATRGWPVSAVEEFSDSGLSLPTRREFEEKAEFPPGRKWVSPASEMHEREVEYLIKHVLPLASIALLIGAPGSYKSFLAVMWSVYVAIGRAWDGHPTQQRTVVYFAGEGQSGLPRRFKAACRALGVDYDSLPLIFLREDQIPDLMSGATVKEMAQEIESLVAEKGWPPVGLVVVDTFSALARADENSAEEVSGFIRNLKYLRTRFGACVLTIHHPGHANQDRARGSSAWIGHLDSSFVLARVAGTMTAELKQTKNKEEQLLPVVGLRAEKHFFGFDSDGDEVTTLSVDVDPQALVEIRRAQEAGAVEVMREIREGGTFRSIAAKLEIEQGALRGIIRGLRKDGMVTPDGALRLTEKARVSLAGLSEESLDGLS
jgi:hypothetical protein